MSTFKYLIAQRASITGAGWTSIMSDWGKLPAGASNTLFFGSAFSVKSATLHSVQGNGAFGCFDWATSFSTSPAVNLRNPAIIAGQQDTYISQFATDIKADGRPYIIFFCNEPNGTWYPAFSDYCNGLHGTFNAGNYAGSFVAMYEHVRAIFASVGVTNVAWGIVINIQGSAAGASTNQAVQPAAQFFSSLYRPDFFGIDGFNPSANPNSPNNFLSFTNNFHNAGLGLLDTLQNVANVDATVPLALASIGSDSYQDANLNASWATAPVKDGGSTGLRKGAYFLDMLLNVCQAAGGIWDRIALIRYYDTDGASIDPPYANGFSCNTDFAIQTPTAAAANGTFCAPAWPFTFASQGQQLTTFQKAYRSSLWVSGVNRLPVAPTNVAGVKPPFPLTLPLYDTTEMFGAPANMLWEARFDESSVADTAVQYDSSGNGLHGVYHGTTLAQLAALPLNATESSISIDGTTYVEVPHQSQFSQIANNLPFWLSGWFKLSAFPASGTMSIISVGTTNLYEWEVKYTATQLFFAAYTLTASQTFGPTWNSFSANAALNIPHRFDAVYDPAGTGGQWFRLYFDGVFKVAGGQPSGLGVGTAPLRIGRRGDNANIAGTVANPLVTGGFRLRNVVPSAAQITSMYQAGLQQISPTNAPGRLRSFSSTLGIAFGVG